MEFNTSNIIGRNVEMENIIQLLKSQSVVLSSHRRMGKTFLLKKIAASEDTSFNFILMIEQGTKSPEEFVYNMYKILQDEKLISVGKGRRFSDWYEKTLAGKEIKDMKLPSFRKHWKEALRHIIEDLVTEQKDKVTVIMVDEFPIMLYEFITEYKLVSEAIELLDTLRKIRQIYSDKGIRFVYCGSIGINVVLDKLKELHSYVGEPINDMSLEILDKMSTKDAKELVKHLAKVRGINIISSINKDETIELLCKSVDCLPFYIDLLIKNIDLKHDDISTESIIKEAKKLIETAGNQGQFNHYVDRISTYYDKDIGNVSKIILNWLSNKDAPVVENEILNMLAQKNNIQEEYLKLILKKLFDDLYLDRIIRDSKRFYSFKYDLVRQWWMINFG